MNIEEIKSKLEKLENLTIKTKGDNFRMGYYRNILKDPEKFLKRYEKVKQTNANKTEEQKEIERKNKSLSVKSSEKFQIAIKSKERSKKISESKKGKKRSLESRRKQSEATKGKKMTGARLERQQEVIKSIHETHGNPAFKIKKQQINGITCQGRSELAYLKTLIDNNEILPLKEKQYVKTPYGYYHPDFEYLDKFIEIKSSYTYNIFIGKEKDADGEYTNQQLYKVIWTGKNVKPVELYIVDKDQIIDTIIFDSSFDESKIEELKVKEVKKIKLTPEERAQIAKEVGLKQRGKILTDEHRNNISNKAQERKLNDPERHKKIYEERSKRRKEKLASMTEEEKMIKKQKNSERTKKMWEELRNNPEKMAERSRKLSEKNKGKKASEETRKKLADIVKSQWEKLNKDERKEKLKNCHKSLIGREVSEETRKKISESNKITKNRIKG